MIGWLRRYRQPLFIAVIAIFLIGVFVGLGGYFFIGADASDSVAVVGGAKIPYAQYRLRVNQYLDMMRERKVEVTPQMENEVKQGMLRDMIVDELLSAEAERLGLRVSDMELAMSLQNTPAFQREGKFDQDIYFQTVRYSLHLSPEQFEKNQRRTMLSAKLKAVLARSAKVAPSEIREEWLREHKGSMKDFDKKKEEFSQALRQRRSLESINAYLRQLAAQKEIRTYLDQREQGI
ncbi:MAG: SurA N-terminal domain-containing protein [Elusimicrobiota bacterium]|jgi:peptidyl-prolyl cis-trans isomerase D